MGGSVQSESPVINTQQPKFASYLPDELLLEILGYFPKGIESQKPLAKFCRISRQWYDVGIIRLYEAPFVVGSKFEPFHNTICPSKSPFGKKSDLASLVKVLDLSHLVHQATKAQTARLLSRTQQSLQKFVAPQASFAVNCWASLSKCRKLRILDLSLVSEQIDHQALNHTIAQLPLLSELYLPRCSGRYDIDKGPFLNMKWPPQLQHLQLSGNVYGHVADMIHQPQTVPHTMTSLSICYCPKLTSNEIRKLLRSLAPLVTKVRLHDLPEVSQGALNGVLQWMPQLTDLTIAVDYIDVSFGHMPEDFSPQNWRSALPLESLTLVTSGLRSVDPHRAFVAIDLFTLIDERYLGRLRFVRIAASTGWASKDDAAETEALEMMLMELDQENWEKRRWHYERFKDEYKGVAWKEWIFGKVGWGMRARLRIMREC
ncbi:hypothetical protein B0J11DRAFT_432940 [Dendryphion nanum]|uniref:F-box domain-containing protein n=1 Tax=Dendryphion nanum TaxID=256645 RepID=A0A9P9DWV6_9PLEO|nr:hypothetical protein B0J11DRAFT_432940 [Dendryphion nanum]